MTRGTKQTVKPPRKPKGEDPQVTIGNQDKQIKLLTERIVAVVKERDDLQSKWHRQSDQVVKLNAEVSAQKREIGYLHTKLRDADMVHERTKGWMDCAREFMKVPPKDDDIPF